MAEKDLPTILREIALKAVADKSHRFGGLYHLLDEASLKECFDNINHDWMMRMLERRIGDGETGAKRPPRTELLVPVCR